MNDQEAGAVSWTHAAERPVRVAIVGLSADGGWASRSHLPALRNISGYTVHGVLASSPERSRRAAEAHGIPRVFASIEELAASKEVDLAVVAVKVPEHARVIVPLVAAGKNVLCEWPLGRSPDEAAELAALAEGAGVRSFIGLQARSLPVIRYVQHLVARGAIGRVTSTSLLGAGMSWGPTTNDRSAYLRDSDNGAGLLTIPLGHALDAMAVCLGEFSDLDARATIQYPTVRNLDSGAEVRADSPDHIGLVGVLESGAMASVFYQGGRSAGRNLLWKINGTEGELCLSGESGHLQHGHLELLGAIDGDHELRALPVPDSFENARQLQGRTDSAHSLANAYVRLLADLTTGSATIPTFADAALRQRMLGDVANKGFRQPMSNGKV